MESIPLDLRLAGEYAALEPLQTEHCTALLDAASDGELWNLRVTTVPGPGEVEEYVGEALEQRQQGAQFPFVVRRLSDRQIVGCTRYYGIRPAHRNLAIGYTWYAKSAQRTAVNTDCKLLLLGYAFEQLDCVNVAFHTHHENYASQAAIQRLGAKHDGVLRNDQVMPDGQVRDTYCYSIIDTEWPQVKRNLIARLAGTPIPR